MEVGWARERVTDLAGDLLLEPGGLLPQRLHARGGRARTTRRRTGPAEATRGPGPGGLQPPLWFSPRFARLAWIASSVRLSGAFAVVGFPHGPFSSGQPGRSNATACAPLVVGRRNNQNGSGCQAGPAGRFARGCRTSPCVRRCGGACRSRGRGRGSIQPPTAPLSARVRRENKHCRPCTDACYSTKIL